MVVEAIFKESIMSQGLSLSQATLVCAIHISARQRANLKENATVSNEQLYETLKLQLIDAVWKIYQDGSAKLVELPFYACRKSLFVTRSCERLNDGSVSEEAQIW